MPSTEADDRHFAHEVFVGVTPGHAWGKFVGLLGKVPEIMVLGDNVPKITAMVQSILGKPCAMLEMHLRIKGAMLVHVYARVQCYNSIVCGFTKKNIQINNGAYKSTPHSQRAQNR